MYVIKYFTFQRHVLVRNHFSIERVLSMLFNPSKATESNLEKPKKLDMSLEARFLKNYHINVNLNKESSY